MKKFKEYLLEDKPTTSPSEEAKRRIAFERDVMGMPQQINAKKDMQDLSRHADQVAYERSVQNPDLEDERYSDQGILDSALERGNAIRNFERTADDYGLDTALPIYKYATGILKDTVDKAAKSASERLHANPTYKYSSTEKIQKDEK
jgi:hypothetical protein